MGAEKNILAFQFYINGIQRNAGVSGLLLGRLEKSKEFEIVEFAEYCIFIQKGCCTLKGSKDLINLSLLVFLYIIDAVGLSEIFLHTQNLETAY